MYTSRKGASLRRTLPTVALSVLLGAGMMGALAGCAGNSGADEIQGETVPAATQQETAPDQAQGGASLAEQDTQGTETAGTASGRAAADKSTSAENATQGTDGTISQDEALALALGAADLTDSDVTVTQNKLDTENGTTVYEIEFVTDAQKFDYTINATTGAVMEQSVENINGGSSATANGTITEAEAKSIAAERAGVAESACTFTQVQLERDDSLTVYEVEFVSGGVQYDVTINAQTSAVIDYETETL